MEDVDFMKKNSIKQNYTFLVDSRDRDKIAYPTPSQYVVSFTAPFHNVIGLDVIDATIPRTMYNIDSYNNSLSFFIHSSNFGLSNLQSSLFNTVYVPVGDYTVQTLIPALNSVMYGYVNSNTMNPYVPIVASATTNPPDVRNTLQFTCSYPFLFDMQKSTIAESLGFDLYVDVKQSGVAEASRLYEPIYFANYSYSDPYNLIAIKIISNNNPDDYVPLMVSQTGLPVSIAQQYVSRWEPLIDDFQLYHSVDEENPAILQGPTYNVFEGPRSVILLTPISNGARAAQVFYVNENCFMTSVSIGFGLVNRSAQVPSALYAHWALYPVDANGLPITSGSPIVTSPIAVDFVDGGLSVDIVASPIPLTQQTYYALVIYDDLGTIPGGLAVYYNDIVPPPSRSIFFAKANSSASWTDFDIDDIYYAMSAQITVCKPYHKVTAPGIYNLIGDRYIVLRCPEIEENSYRSLAYTKHNMGLAKFRMGITGYGDHRMDFSSVPTREFHPIGRFSRMTLRFERPDGTLYDFKGVNHIITFAIKYYEPTQKNEFEVSVINPNYNGDFVKYLRTQEEQEEESDDGEDYDRDTLLKYKRAEMQFMPSQIQQRDLEALYLMDLEDNDA
jgi:hypothetical protein